MEKSGTTVTHTGVKAGKIAELQDKLRDLKKQKTELENNELVSLCRDNGISPADLAAYLREKEKSRKADETEGNYED
ncbi:MAG: DUF4315 family protein [Ruminococcus sp.]|nr:DUF4315 family protein [Ruminococcus sp.]